MTKNKTKKINLAIILFLLLPFFKGLHDILTTLIVAAILIVATIIKSKKSNSFNYSFDKKFIIILIWSLSYFIVSFYAIDRGSALLGALKMLTIPVFLLFYFQYDFSNENKTNIYTAISYSGALMTIISLMLCIFPSLRVYFFNSNRLQGFFFYANSFGIWLLIGLISMLCQKNLSKRDIAVILILAIGIVLTNSRAIIILMILSCIATFFISKDDKKKHLYTVLLIGACILTTMLLLHFININTRLSDVTSSSEFLTRLFYYKDAVSQILKHPFGLGHYGWWTIQQYIQTAVYDCEYVHNSLLQVALDVGVLPCLLLSFLVITTIFDKNVDNTEKLIFIVLLVHSMIDFDFEFLIIMYLLVTIPKYKLVKTNTKKIYFALIPLLCVFIYFSIVIIAYNNGNNKLAYTLYPNYTYALRRQILISDNLEEKEQFALRANKLNKYSSDIYQALFDIENEKGNISEAYEYMRKIISLNKYSMVAYTKYLNFLETSMYTYMDLEDTDNVKLYMERIIEVPQLIDNVLKETNPLAFESNHPPLLDIPEAIQDFISEVTSYYIENFQEI